MPKYDQRLKELIREMIDSFLELILPGWAGRFHFARIEWLQQEVFADPPQGERRLLDLVARLPRNQPAEDGSAEVLLHIEVESEDRTTRARRQLSDGYRLLRQRHDRPVLPLALYLNVALEGRGTDSYREQTEGLDVYELRFPYLGLPGLDARVYVEGENLLGVALSVLMRIADEERPWLKARAIQRIATAPLAAYRRFLLVECVEAYGGLEGPRLAEFEKLLLTEEFREAQMLAKTTYEKGLEQGLGQGQRVVLVRMLERRFGPLSASARARLDSWTEERLLQLADDLLTPKGLAELGLEDAPNGTPPQGS